MSGKTTADYKNKPNALLEDMSNGNFDFDKRLIQLNKDVKTKIDEAKARINEHIQDDHRDDDIFKFLSHTKRGRLLCGLFGYKSSNKRRIIKRDKIRKLNRKRKQIIEV